MYGPRHVGNNLPLMKAVSSLGIVIDGVPFIYAFLALLRYLYVGKVLTDPEKPSS